MIPRRVCSQLSSSLSHLSGATLTTSAPALQCLAPGPSSVSFAWSLLRAPASSPARGLHSSPAHHNTAILAGGLAIAGAALAGRYGLRVLDAMKADGGADKASSSPAPAAAASVENGAEAKAGGETAGGASSASSTAPPPPPPPGGGGFFGSFFGGQAMARRFYKGGFEDPMTRREAALILGARESASPERIRDRHRKMLMINHPDAGGSTFIATKINEAKDLLLKGRGK